MRKTLRTKATSAKAWLEGIFGAARIKLAASNVAQLPPNIWPPLLILNWQDVECVVTADWPPAWQPPHGHEDAAQPSNRFGETHWRQEFSAT